MAFLLMMPTVSLTSCSDDDGPEIPAEGTDDKFDGLKWFEGSLVTHDPDGRLVRLYGCVLDEASPRSITIGVDSREEAVDLFKSWVAPGDEDRLTTLSDGTVEYRPTSELGLPQGLIRMEMPAGEEYIARVSFSEGALIDEVSDITFISNDSWPDNGATLNVFSPYTIGDKVRFDTDKGFTHGRDGEQWGMCIREATRSQVGLIVYISNTTPILRNTDDVSDLMPDKKQATMISDVLRANWKAFEESYKALGYPLTDDHYWVRDRKSFYGRYAVSLKTGDIDWYDTVSRKPHHHYLLYMTFEPCAE